MKLVLKNADGESVCITVKAEDTFLDLKARIADEDGLDLDIEHFNIKGHPIQNHFNVIEYFRRKQTECPKEKEICENEVDSLPLPDLSHVSSTRTEWKMCRLCAGTCEPTGMVPMAQLIDTIASCLPIKVELHDNLSKSVCPSCVDKLNKFKEFIDGCVEAEKKQQELAMKKSFCPICSKDDSRDKSLSTSEFFEALEQHNSVCLQADAPDRETEEADEAEDGEEGSNIFVFCSMCRKNVPLVSCLQGTCHEGDVFCCFLCDASLKSSNDLRQHLKEHLGETAMTKKSVVMWKCTTCEVGFSDMVSFEQHLRSHQAKVEVKEARVGTKQVVRCPVCQKMFRCQARLDFHVRFHEEGARAGQCTECRKEFPSESCLYKHMLYNHVNPKQFTCQECGKMFRNKSSLTYHSRSHTSLEAMKPFVCDLCKKRFARKNILKDHMSNRHGGVTSVQPLTAFQCRVCKEAFPNTTSAISHMEIHHADMERAGDAGDAGYCFDMLSVFKLFVCEMCDKCYPLPTTVMEHRSGHNNKYQCKLCNHEFLHYPDLRVHVDGHSADGIMDYKNDFRVPILLVCEFCEKCFRNYQTFTAHTSLHLEHAPEPYECRFCPGKFATHDDAVRHRASHARATSRMTNTLKPFECQYCDKSFTSGSALTKHVRVHSGEKPFKCDVCLKRFTQSSGLNTHRKVHSDERPYQCDLCDRSFKILGDYKLHIRKHTGIRSHKCDFCSKTFMTRQAYNQHRKIHENLRPYVCDICHESFQRHQTLKLHLRKHDRLQ